VYHDLLGFAPPGHRMPKFVRQYAAQELEATEAVGRFVEDVRAGLFPANEETYHMADQMLDALGLYGAAST
jgi:3-methyl-2-oxobutanoate hydroxymethyltransferase